MSGIRTRLEEATEDKPQWVADLSIIGGTYAGIVVLFVLLGGLVGLDANGIMSALQQVTFFAAAYAILVLALNLQWGYTGLFNIGVAGFMAIGVYTVSILSASPESSVPGLGLPLWVSIPIAMLVAALVGAVAALPALRVRADYFAIVTLGFAEIVRLTAQSGSLRSFEIAGRELGTGGGSGMGFPNLQHTVSRTILYVDGDRGEGSTIVGQIVFSIIPPDLIRPAVVEGWVYTLFLFFMLILVYLLVVRIGQSPFGRMLKAIREDELAAKSLGKDTNRTKLIIFMVGCSLMALGGILWRGSRGYVDPNLFMPLITFYIFVALIIGGSGSNTGSIVGGFVFAGILLEGPRYVDTILSATFNIDSPANIYEAILALGSLEFTPLLGHALSNIEFIRFMLVGAVLIVLMIYRPDGLLGHRTEIASTIDLRTRPTAAEESVAADGGDADE